MQLKEIEPKTKDAPRDEDVLLIRRVRQGEQATILKGFRAGWIRVSVSSPGMGV